MILFLILAVCIIARYKIKIKWMKSRKIVDEKYTIMNSREKIYILFEICIIALMPYPFFAGNMI